MSWLVLFWGGIIAFGVILYVLLDGFDLGVGILTPFIKNEKDRSIMISTILPVWDGNQTWLVFGGAALYGAFPYAFSQILPMLYIPLILMVVALLFRGVAFEFRLKSPETKHIWDYCFFGGSLIATFLQGMVLGTFVKGFQISTGETFTHMYQWISPFSILCGFALVFGYLLLGVDRLIAKTTGHLQELCYKYSMRLQVLIAIFAIIVSIWSPFLDPSLAKVWFNRSYMPFLAILPLATICLFAIHHNGLIKKQDHTPFWSLVGIFIMCYIGFGISTFPYIIPRHVTLMQAAAPEQTLKFMTIGACIMLPILFYYTYTSYRVFKGKVTESVEY